MEKRIEMVAHFLSSLLHVFKSPGGHVSEALVGSLAIIGGVRQVRLKQGKSEQEEREEEATKESLEKVIEALEWRPELGKTRRAGRPLPDTVRVKYRGRDYRLLVPDLLQFMKNPVVHCERIGKWGFRLTEVDRSDEWKEEVRKASTRS